MDYDVVILPSFAQAEAWCKQWARQRGEGIFAQVVTTFDAWIADLWELHGDGRTLVDSMRREVMMRALLDTSEEGDGLPGVAPLAAALIRDASGVPAFEQALVTARKTGMVEGLSARESALMKLLARYEDCLCRAGFIETGMAAALLAGKEREVFSRPLRVLLAETPPLSFVQAHFYDACTRLETIVQHARGASGVERAPKDVEVRFAFPSGRLAEPGLIVELVRDRATLGDIVIVSADPLELGEAIGSQLSDLGMRMCVEARKSFAQTDFGRAFFALYRSLHEEPWDPAFVSDAVCSPFSGFPPGDSLLIDARLRSNRIAQRDEVLFELGAASERFSQLVDLASDPDADVLIGMFEQMAQSSAHQSAAWRAEQLSALSALRDAMASARFAHADIGVCAAVLERAAVPVSYQQGEGSASVTIATWADAAKKPSRSCATLVLADMTSEDYPVSDADDAAVTLLAKLGIASADDALSRTRREFHALAAAPTRSLVLVRPLGDKDAAETHPSVVLEEFVDAYRNDLTDTKDIDNEFLLPPQLQEGIVVRGEELLFANAEAGDRDVHQLAASERPCPGLGDLKEGDVRLVAPWRSNSRGNRLELPCPSPSQVEVYLECPYKWFASSRLRIGGLDEGFGSLERGSFAHRVLEAFYRRYGEAGYAKVTPEGIEEAKKLMGCVFDECAQGQFSEEPGSGRYVPKVELERRQVALLRKQLISYLDVEAKLLPTFHPKYLEYSIDADHAAHYAGVLLVGTIDRIDVDDAGNAVIIDYKGSVTDDHAIGGKDASNIGKVQGRMYAQVVRRVLGLNVVGALYVGYGKKQQVIGAYDATAIAEADLPNMNHGICMCRQIEGDPDALAEDVLYAHLSFGRMLDETEDTIADAIARMVSGDVEPRPAHADACRYCLVANCPKRSA